MSNLPITEAELAEISNEACSKSLNSAKAYDHSKASEWNTAIINSILQSLIAAVPPQSYKFAVNSTVIQQEVSGSKERTGPRGMHSASGAFWNSEMDGQWSFKVEGEDQGRGFDVVVSVIWVKA